MQCQRCGKEVGISGRCDFCGYDNKEGNIRKMTSIEKNFYDGVTIDAGDTEGNSEEKAEQNFKNSNSYNQKSNYRFSRRTIYISNDSGFFSRLMGKFFNGLSSNNRVLRIAVTLIVIAISLLMCFVALPILFVLLAVGIALLAFSKLGR